jgi:serine/threonine protein kinase
MPKLSVTEAEWQHAKSKLNKQPNGTKLNRKKSGLAHSFIKMNNEIYALANKQDTNSNIKKTKVASTTIVNIKYAQSSDGETVIAKKSIEAPDHGIVEKHIEDTDRYDRDLSVSIGIAQTKYDLPVDFHYDGQSVQCRRIMNDLGKDFFAFSKSNNDHLSEATRFSIAIQFCWQVHRLHAGWASKNGTRYAHQDIKPNNITIDDKGIVHLIDFDDVIPEDDEKSRTTHRSPDIYTPYVKADGLTKQQFDIVALKRSLFMPTSLWHRRHPMNLNVEAHERMLSEDMLRKYQLNPYINTFNNETDTPPDYSSDQTTAATLCAILIAARYQLNIAYTDIASDHHLAQTIALLWSKGFIDDINQQTDLFKAIKENVSDNQVARQLDKAQDKHQMIAVLNCHHCQIQINDDLPILSRILTNATSQEHAQKLAQLHRLLDEIKLKKEYFANKKQTKAHAACETLITNIDRLCADFFDPTKKHSQTEFQQFREKYINELDQARIVLADHRGILGVLDTALTILASLVVFYPAVYFYQKHYRIQNTFFKTKSEVLLETAETKFHTLTRSQI